MLCKLKLKLNNRISYNKGSSLQGFIMENINTEYAEMIHTQNLRPYSQFVETNKEQSIWHINTYTNDAKENIIDVIKSKKEILLTNNNINNAEEKILIEDVVEENITEEDLFRRNYNIKTNRYAKINILTPISFKQNDNYIFFPDIHLIFQNLIMKYNLFMIDFNIQDENLFDNIINNVKIVDYNLKSKYFYLEGIKIKGFIGSLTFQINGPTPFVSIVNMLLDFASFCGIGIKTAIGMGGIEVQ